MFVNKLKMDGIAEAVKKCMAEDDLEETGLRKAAYAAHTKGEKMFTFKGKTYPVKVQGEDVSYGESVKEETDKAWDARNKEIKDAKQKVRGEIIAQKASLKSKTQKEETEIDEAMSGEVTKTKTGLVHRSTKAYGGSKPEKHVVDTLKGPKTKDLMKTLREMMDLIESAQSIGEGWSLDNAHQRAVIIINKRLKDPNLSPEYRAELENEKKIQMARMKRARGPSIIPKDKLPLPENEENEAEIDEAMSGEVTKTKTGLVHRSTKAYGGSKPEKHVVDTLKGPKTKDLMKTDKEDAMKTRGKYDEEMEFKNKLIEGYKVKKEELKGSQHKIDKNKNNKIDAHDFAILRAQQKEEVELDKASCEDEVKKHEKKMHGKDGEVAKHVDKMHKEEIEQIEEKEMTDAEMKKREDIVKGMKKSLAGFKARYGARAKDVMYATATKQAMKEESVEEEIDPNVRTKDTLKGQEPTSQKDDVGPGSDAKSTKVKFRGGPMKEEVKKSDIPAFIRKARGDKPLTVADAKAGRKDSISSKENLAKARGVQEGKRPESDTVPFITDEQKPPFDKPYTTSPKTVKDKSGAKHTPMSRARDLARQAMKRIKTEMLGKAPGNNG